MTHAPLPEGLSLTDVPMWTRSMELVDRHQRGEERALDELLARYQDRIRRIVRIRLGSRLRSHVQSMDIVQEANIVAARKLAGLEIRDQASLIRWLSQIVLNQIRDADDYLSRDKRAVDRELRLDVRNGRDEGPPEQIAANAPGPEEEVWRAELSEILDHSISGLPDDYREVILMRDYQCADWSDIAEALGRQTVGGVRELHRRAWIRLRKVVRPRLDGLL